MTVGKTPSTRSAESTGIAGLGCRFGKYDVQAVYVASTRLYGTDFEDKGFAFVSVARYWRLEKHKLLGGIPEVYWGLGFKGADRCDYNGESDCNRRMPLPVSFHFGAGLAWKNARIQLLHDSNNAMDYGSEKKNLGITWLTLTVPLL